MKFLLYYSDLRGKEREDFLVSLVRGFQPAENYLSKYRYKPCAAMLAEVYERMSTFDPYKF